MVKMVCNLVHSEFWRTPRIFEEEQQSCLCTLVQDFDVFYFARGEQPVESQVVGLLLPPVSEQ